MIHLNTGISGIQIDHNRCSVGLVEVAVLLIHLILCVHRKEFKIPKEVTFVNIVSIVFENKMRKFLIEIKSFKFNRTFCRNVIAKEASYSIQHTVHCRNFIHKQ